VKLTRTESVGLSLAVASAAAYGTSSVVIKVALRHHLTVATLVTLRLGVASLFLWVLVSARRIPWREGRRRAAVLLAAGTTTAVPWILSSASLTRLPAQAAGLLLFTYPAWVTGFQIALHRERLSVGKVLAIGLGLLGVALLLGSPAGLLDGAGVALALMAAVALAGYIVLVATVIRDTHPVAVSAYLTTGGAILMAVVAGGTGLVHPSMTASSWGWIVLLGLTSAVGISMFLPAMTRIGATRTSIASNFQPIVTVVLAAVVLSERLSVLQLLGSALIVGSVATLPMLRERREEDPEAVGGAEALAVADLEVRG
jgi:drug/metabolite transporter (DMT)-like permease